MLMSGIEAKFFLASHQYCNFIRFIISSQAPISHRTSWTCIPSRSVDSFDAMQFLSCFCGSLWPYFTFLSNRTP